MPGRAFSQCLASKNGVKLRTNACFRGEAFQGILPIRVRVYKQINYRQNEHVWCNPVADGNKIVDDHRDEG
jgi:hypothetical protein